MPKRRSNGRKKLKIKGPSLGFSPAFKKMASRFFTISVAAVFFILFYVAHQNGCLRIPKISVPQYRHTPAKPSSVKPPPRQGHRFVSGRPKIVIVIDDIGYNLDNLLALENLSDQVTYAILPRLPYSKFFGRLSEKTGAEVLLHLPLESINGYWPGPGLITSQLSADQVLTFLRNDLASVPNHVGVNNHMGSKGTADPALMRIILGEVKKEGLFFLDSHTTSKSVAPAVGREVGIPLLVRDVFLDNIDEPQAIRSQIRLLASKARDKGYAIAIGHYRRITLDVLREEIPKLKQQGFELITLSDLLAYLKLR